MADDEHPPISDHRLAVYHKLLAEISENKLPASPFVIGITGIDCAGKSLFTDGFEIFLRSNGLKTQVIRLDDFHNPRKIRHSGDKRDELYYERVKQGYSFNFTRIVEELLLPVRINGELKTRLRGVDYLNDTENIERAYTVSPETVVILEGVFLFLDIISPYIDYTVYLDISPDECRERARSRDPEEVFRNYDRKYIRASEEYLAEYPPASHADIIIDNTDWNHPRIA
ncbi:MAG: hypothetical protein MUO19_02515 [Dehalococcoidales bacterium]|nr:hypothetical protein [Dehalococcoidales bacterium]